MSGYTRRNHTFFEMLGNFFLASYFKADAIEFAWSLITKEYGLSKDRLYVTVFETDDEAEESWQRVAGVPKDRIFRLGAKDNFWQMGETGPCGPCSEIFYDFGEEADPGKSFPDDPGQRFVEIWNLVFRAFDRDYVQQYDRRYLALPATPVWAWSEWRGTQDAGRDLLELRYRPAEPYRPQSGRSYSARRLATTRAPIPFSGASMPITPAPPRF